MGGTYTTHASCRAPSAEPRGGPRCAPSYVSQRARTPPRAHAASLPLPLPPARAGPAAPRELASCVPRAACTVAPKVPCRRSPKRAWPEQQRGRRRPGSGSGTPAARACTLHAGSTCWRADPIQRPRTRLSGRSSKYRTTRLDRSGDRCDGPTGRIRGLDPGPVLDRSSGTHLPASCVPSCAKHRC